MQGHKAAVWDG